jgi:hypothetical protein
MKLKYSYVTRAPETITNWESEFKYGPKHYRYLINCRAYIFKLHQSRGLAGH